MYVYAHLLQLMYFSASRSVHASAVVQIYLSGTFLVKSIAFHEAIVHDQGARHADIVGRRSHRWQTHSILTSLQERGWLHASVDDAY